SEVAAECLGVNTFALRLRVFVLSGAYAGLAGVFFAYWLAVVSPEAAGFELSVQFLLMVVLGGLGTVWGAITGSVAVQALDEGMRTLIPTIVPGATGEVQLIGFGVVLVLVVVLLPGGLAQLWNMITSRLRGRPRRLGAADEVPTAAVDAGEDAHAVAAPLDDILDAEALPDPGTMVLSVRNLTKRYGGVLAVDGVDFDVRAGEILALIGPNGAGKTTCFNMISGVLAPTEGTVEVAGTRVEGRRPHVVAELGATRTFQNLQVFGSSTVLGNVTDLPFGRQRQLEVARALALSPTILLLDEPMAGLSGSERAALGELLRRTRGAGVAVVLVEHDVEAVMALADRVAVLDDGRLIALGPPEQVRKDPAVIAAYLGTDAQADELVRTAAHDHAQEVR
ncbi:MAG: ATP-binding cassette domain-containing protein, partial [Jiangellaceae bacterium]